MNNSISKENSFYYPPGGILIWIIVFLELITFSSVVLVFLYQRSLDPVLFNLGQLELNQTIGLINTLVLLTSSLFMAQGLYSLKRGNQKKSLTFLSITVLLGVTFLFLKGWEYYSKIEMGFGLSSNTFFTYYWLLTGFHFVHVLIGLLLISYALLSTKSGTYSASNFEDVESIGIFWHMCDLIWVFLFPLMYLLH